MYFYILDPTNIPAERFEKCQIELQGLLAEFNVSGETARVGPLRGIPELIDTARSRGVRTLVACGTDDTFNLMLAHLKNQDFTVAFVPFEENSFLAKILGLTDLRTSVKTIAGRRIEPIDLAYVNSFYFISYLELGLTPYELQRSGTIGSIRSLMGESVQITARIDNSYNITLPLFSGMIVNSRSTTNKDLQFANPSDGFLDFIVIDKPDKYSIWQNRELISQGMLEKIPNSTVIRCKKLELLEPKGFPIYIAGKILTKFPATVDLLSNKLRMIVGRNRTF